MKMTRRSIFRLLAVAPGALASAARTPVVAARQASTPKRTFQYEANLADEHIKGLMRLWLSEERALATGGCG